MKRSEEGAVMFIVMLILLMGTATAIFAMHTTSYEVRASGFNKRLMQTQNIGESGLMAMMSWTDRDPKGMRENWLAPCTRQSQIRDSTSLNLEPFEPEITDPTKNACRMYQGDFDAAFAAPVMDSAAALGDRQSNLWNALLLVDAYEDYDSGGSVPGEDSAGGRGAMYLDVTFTARGRTRLGAPGTDFVSGVAGDRDFHEGAVDSRVFARTGPIPR